MFFRVEVFKTFLFAFNMDDAMTLEIAFRFETVICLESKKRNVLLQKMLFFNRFEVQFNLTIS